MSRTRMFPFTLQSRIRMGVHREDKTAPKSFFFLALWPLTPRKASPGQREHPSQRMPFCSTTTTDKDVSQSLHWELFPAVSSSPSPLSQPHFPPHAVASQSPGARGTRLAFDISSGAHTQSTLCAPRPAAGGSPTARHLARAGAASGTFPAGPHSSAIEGSKKPFCAAAWSGASVPGAQSGH